MTKKIIFLCSFILSIITAHGQGCETISTFPYAEDFSAFNSNCWTMHSTNPPLPMVNQSPVVNSNALMFMASAGGHSMAVMPRIDNNIDLHFVTLDFSYNFTSSNIPFEIGVMTDSSDITTFQSVATFTSVMLGPPADNFEHVDFSTITGNPHFIAFRLAPTNGSANVWLDNITLSQVSSCAPPTNLVISNISGSSALLTWTASLSATLYGVEVVDLQGNLIFSQNTENTLLPISGLSEQTEYTVMLYPICDGENGDTITYNLITQCNQIHQSEFVGSNPTSIMYGGHVPFCVYGANTYSQQIFKASELGSAQDIRVIELNYYYNIPLAVENLQIFLGHTPDSVFDCPSCWVTQDSLHRVYNKAITFDNNDGDNWFSIILDSAFSYNGTDNLVIAFYDTIATIPAAMPRMYTHPTDSIQSISKFNMYSGNSIDLNNLTAGEMINTRSNIRFVQSCFSQGCVPPNVMITNIGDFTANAILAGSDAGEWELQYKTTTDTTWTVVLLQSPEYSFTQLSSNTVYQVRVKSICDNGEESNWTLRSFRTTCGIIDELPWTENFSYYSEDHQNMLPSCWVVESNFVGFPQLDTTIYATAPASLHLKSNEFSYNIIALPELSETFAMSDLMLSLSLYSENLNNSLEIGFASDLNFDSSYTQFSTLIPTELYQWQSYDLLLDEYEGNAKYIVLKSDTRSDSIDNEIFIDNISLMVAPTCPRPTSVVVNNITQNSVQVSWNVIGTAVDYMVGIFLAGTEPIASEFEYANGNNVYTPTSSLLPNTAYDVYVQSICAEENSPYTAKVTFRTTCESIDFTDSYTENFDSYGVGNHAFPYCWNRLSNNIAQLPFISDYYTYQSSTGSIRMEGVGLTDTMMIVSPNFDSVNVALQVNFMLRSYDTYVPVQVGLITDPADMNTFIPVETVFLTQNNVWVEQEVILNQYAGQVTYIAIRTIGNNTFYIDDFNVSEAHLCFEPETLSVSNITDSSAILSWIEMGTAQSWILEYGEQGFAEGNGIQLSPVTFPYTLNGLQAETAYEFHVKALCTAVDTSDWSEMVQFTTDAAIVPVTCNPPVNLSISNVTPYTATISWEAQNEETQWQVRFKKQSENTFTEYLTLTPSYEFTNLSDSCMYDVQVIAICSDELQSEPATISFTTLHDGIAENILNQSVLIYPNPAEEYLCININRTIFEPNQIELFNGFGQSLMMQKVDSNTIILDLSTFSSGFYFIKISDSKNMVTKKIIKK